MQAIGLEFLFILILLACNGVFAMTEIAMVSSRKSRLRQLAAEGSRGAEAALLLAADPNRFLPTVQIGITLVGVLAGAFGGATIAAQLDRFLEQSPTLAPYSETISVGIVVLVVTYFSLIIGELVPKRLALGNPEGIACRMGRPMQLLAKAASPAVFVLGVSTNAVLRVLGAKPKKEAPVSDEEIRALMEEGREAGIFHKAEPQMVERVLALDNLPVSDIMTPRARIVFLNKHDAHDAVWHKIVVSGHSNFPVYEGNRDNVVGLVSVKSIYANLAAGTPSEIANLMIEPLVVPETQHVTRLLETFRESGSHTALVANEFGGIVGIVTLVDVLEAIVGRIETPDHRNRPAARKRPDGSWLADAAMEIEALLEALPDLPFPPEAQREYDTLAGFILEHTGHGIDKVLITHPAAPHHNPPAQ